MTINPVQGRPNPAASKSAAAKPAPQGVSQMPDRLEMRPQEPPSVFKEFLFKPLFQAIKFLMRCIFNFFDFLRNVSFEETREEGVDREGFLSRLASVPKPEKILHQFEEIYSTAQQNQIYHVIGQAHPSKTSWKESIWDRSPQENIALGRRLVRQNPYLLRDYLT
jgi:hypothetical protein